MLWAIDEKHTDRLVVDYPYFETADPIVFEDQGTYVQTEDKFPAHHHAQLESWPGRDRHGPVSTTA